MYKYTFAILFILLASCKEKKSETAITNVSIEEKVNTLLEKMTLEEKIGQMNQYNGFWDMTGSTPKEGNAALKYEHLKKGWVG